MNNVPVLQEQARQMVATDRGGLPAELQQVVEPVAVRAAEVNSIGPARKPITAANCSERSVCAGPLLGRGTCPEG